jgi:ethanolamine utilization protein EutN
MQLAAVIGRTNATIKHPALNGWKLMIVQPLDLAGGDDGEPQIAIDRLGSSVGDKVMITADGAAIRDFMGRVDTPVRFAVIGIKD